MKLSNNAIKFLMAQYRAIYKNAYVKGLATAVILTSALAAGQAQAVDKSASDLASGTLEIGTDNLKAEAETATKWDAIVNVGAAQPSNAYIGVGATAGGAVSYTGNGSLNINATNATSGAKIFQSGAGKALTVDISSISANAGTLTISGSGAATTVIANTITIGDGSDTTTVSGTVAVSGEDTRKEGKLGRLAGNGKASSVITLNADGVLTLSGAKNASDAVVAGKLVGNGGTIKVSGSGATLNVYGNVENINLEVNSVGASNAGAIISMSDVSGTDDDESTLSIASGNITIKGDGTAANGTKLVLQAGTLDLGAGVEFKDPTESGSQFIIGDGTNAADATLKVTAQQLKNYLAFGGGDKSALINLTSKGADSGSASIFLKPEEGKDTVSLDGLTFSGDGTTKGAINAAASKNASIAADKFEIKSKITGASNIGFSADHMTITNVAHEAKGIKAKTFTFLDENGNNLENVTLARGFTYSAILNDQANPYGGDAKVSLADSASIEQNITIANTTATTLTVADGHYTANNITIGKDKGAGSNVSGNLVLGSGASGVDASLKLNGTLTIDNRGGAENTIKIAGNGNYNSALKPDSTTTVGKSQAVLDLTSSTLAITRGGNKTDITVGENGTLKVTSAQFDKLIESVNGSSGAAVLVDKGTIEVNGAIGDRNTVFFNTITSGGTAATDKITVSSNGGTIKATSAALTTAGGELNLGKGHLSLKEGLALTSTAADKKITNPDGSSGTAPADITIGDADITVGNSLTTDRNNDVILGNGTSGAVLNLGYASAPVDKYGYATEEAAKGVFDVTSQATDNSVGSNLVLKGVDADKSKLNINYGKWTAKDIVVEASGDITVGQSGSTEVPASALQYGAGAPELKAKKVELKGTANLNINPQASATFEQLIAGAAAKVNVSNSTLTITGKEVTDKDNKVVSYGFETVAPAADANKITVEGSKGVLTIGTTALKALDLKNFKTTGSGTAAVTSVAYVADLTNKTPFNKVVDLNAMGTLKLDFESGTKLSAGQVHALREAFVSGSSYGVAIKDGVLDLGGAVIDGLTVNTEDKTVKYTDLKAFNDTKGNFGDVTNADLKGAQVIDIGQGQELSANVGSIKLNGADSTATIGRTNLYTAKDGLFVSNVDNPTKPGSATVLSGGSLGLYNGGKIGTVTLTSGFETAHTSLTVSSESAETTIARIKGGNNTDVTINGITTVEKGIDNVGTLVVNDDLKVLSGGITATTLGSSEGSKPGKITADSLSVKSDVDAIYTTYNGDFEISGVAEFQTYAELGGQNMKFGTLKFGLPDGSEDLKLVQGNTSAAVLDVTGTGNKDSNSIFVGTESKLDDKGNIVESGSSATLYAARAQLNGNDVYADPAFGLPASLVMFKQVGKETDLTEAMILANGNKAGKLDGGLNALRNSVIAVGIDGKDAAEAQNAVRSDLANLFDANGSLVDPSVKGNEDGIASVIYVAQALDLSKNSMLVAYNDTFSNTMYKYDNDVDGFQKLMEDNSVYLGANTALAISDVATAAVKTTTTGTGKDAVTTTTGRAAIHFNSDAAAMYAEKDAKILLTGDGLKAGSTVNLFSDNGATGSEGIKLTLADGVESITVQSINGLLKYDMKAGENVGQGVTLALDMNVVNNSYNDASEPVKHAIVSYLAGDMNWDDTSANAKKVQLLGDNVSGTVKYEGGKFVWTDATVTDKLNQADFVAVETKDPEGKVTYEVYKQAYNALLDNANKTTSGRDVESVARMGVFGGAAQAALTATGTTADAVSGRFGMGQQAGTMTVSSNGQGSGMWVTPVYRSADVDGFGADNVSYGSDVKLFGAAIGGDFTMANGVRVGGMLNIGSGDADGQGIGSAVSNDFNYFGGALYAGFALDNLSIVGDLGYSVIDSDVTANTAIGQASTSFDTTVMTAGVTGQYSMNFGGVDVVPHAGLRFTRIDMDNYDVVTPEADLAHYNASTSNVFSIPVGVTIAKEYVMDTWTVKPSFDLTLTGNFGDDTLDGNVEWAGISNMTTEVKSEFVDSFTYGSAIGIAAKSGNLGLGVGLNYTGSSNVKEFGASANVRYVF